MRVREGPKDSSRLSVLVAFGFQDFGALEALYLGPQGIEEFRKQFQ